MCRLFLLILRLVFVGCCVLHVGEQIVCCGLFVVVVCSCLLFVVCCCLVFVGDCCCLLVVW